MTTNGKAFWRKLGLIFTGVAVLASVAYMAISWHLETTILNRQTRVPDVAAGFITPIELKGVTFYVTGQEAQTYHLINIAFFVFMGAVFLHAIIKAGIRKHPSP